MHNKRVSGSTIKHAFNKYSNKTKNKNKSSYFSRGGVRF